MVRKNVPQKKHITFFSFVPDGTLKTLDHSGLFKTFSDQIWPDLFTFLLYNIHVIKFITTFTDGGILPAIVDVGGFP